MAAQESYILAGDIGGTKTELALYSSSGSPNVPERKARFPSQEYESLAGILKEFLTEKALKINQASFGVAGPVIGGKAKITNLPWSIEAESLADEFGIPVSLINDMDAIAHFVAHIQPSDLVTIHPGYPEEHGARGIIAPGTGLGEGFLVWAEGHYLAYGTEGGHTDFAPRSQEQMALLSYLEQRYEHISYERVCSGMGIPNLFSFYKVSGRYEAPGWLMEEIERSEDPTPAIIQAALNGKAEICGATLDLFVEILGNEAGNLALKLLATGGIYLAGGIPPRIVDWLQKPPFIQAFKNKGRFAQILSRIPVYVVLNKDAGLIGAAWHGFDAAKGGG
jgi:glucokinase